MAWVAPSGPYHCALNDAQPIKFCQTILRQQFAEYQIHQIDSPVSSMCQFLISFPTKIPILGCTKQTFSNSNSRILWMLPCCFLELLIFSSNECTVITYFIIYFCLYACQMNDRLHIWKFGCFKPISIQRLKFVIYWGAI